MVWFALAILTLTAAAVGLVLLLWLFGQAIEESENNEHNE